MWRASCRSREWVCGRICSFFYSPFTLSQWKVIQGKVSSMFCYAEHCIRIGQDIDCNFSSCRFSKNSKCEGKMRQLFRPTFDVSCFFHIIADKISFLLRRKPLSLYDATHPDAKYVLLECSIKRQTPKPGKCLTLAMHRVHLWSE